MNFITVEANIESTINNVWDCWTQPGHVVNWNFASKDWHCPKANSNFNIGGEFHYTMAARDGSVEFDFCGTFTKIIDKTLIEIFLEDGRKLTIQFESEGTTTKVIEIFEPEEVNSIELQQQGWQAILNQFKKYAEGIED